jgi:hypothetical protein
MAHSLVRLGFGKPASEDRINGSFGAELIYHFLPGELFCLVWWWRRRDRRQHWVLAILEAPRLAEVGQVLPDIYPSVLVHAMVDQHGPAGHEGNVDQMLYQIQRVRSRGIEPSRLPARYWQEVAWHVVLHENAPDLPATLGDGDQEFSCDT